MSKGNRASGTHELGVESMQMASFFMSSDPHSVLAPTSVERHVPMMKAHRPRLPREVRLPDTYQELCDPNPRGGHREDRLQQPVS
jgi:hypothetical protein